MIFDLNKATIVPIIKSDHSRLNIMFTLKHNTVRGQGFWKLNSDLLNDTNYTELVYTIIDESHNKYNNLDDKALVLDMIKGLVTLGDCPANPANCAIFSDCGSRATAIARFAGVA